MNSEHINPFVQGAQGTLNMICGETPRLGRLFLKKSPFYARQVSIFVDFTGAVSGSVIYTLKLEDACAIVSKMMFGAPVSELDAMSQSAISELGNMISGNVATNFSTKGILVDITPPKFILNAGEGDFAFIRADKAIVCIPLEFSDGLVFEVDVFVEEA